MVARSLCLAALLVLALPAWADDCTDALDRFDYPAAAALAEARLAIERTDAAVWLCLARSQYERGDFDAALASLGRTDTLAKPPVLQAAIDNWYAVTLRKFGRLGPAWQHQQAALNLARRLADPGTLATALHNTATLLNDMGYKAAALADYRESASFNPNLAERSASLNNMALIEDELGNPDAAESFFKAAIAINRAHGHFHHLGKHLMNLGNHYRQRGRYDEAAALLQEGSALEEKAGDRYWVAVGHRLTAWLDTDRGRKAEAAAELRQAIAGYRATGATPDAEAAAAELAGL